jgi:hypothetical protein
LSYLIKNLKISLNNLFPRKRDKIRFLILTITASSVSILELGLAKIFSEIILSTNGTGKNLLPLIALFVLLSIIAKLIVFAQKTRRIGLFSEALGNENNAKNSNAWNLTLSLEFSNIFGHLLQISLVSFFVFFLSPKFGAIILASSIFSIFILSNLSRKQEQHQTKFFKTRYTKYKVSSKTRVLTRVKSAEIGALSTGIISLATLIVLIIFHHQNLVTTADSIVIFFAIRLLGSNLSALSSSLMRYARALVYSSFGMGRLTQKSLASETLE